MRNLDWSRRTIPNNLLRPFLRSNQRNLLTPKVKAIDSADIIPNLAILGCIPKVEDWTASPETVAGLGDFEGRAGLAVEPLVLEHVAARRDDCRIDGSGAVGGGVPDVKVAFVVDGGFGGGEGGGDGEDDAAEDGGGTHDEGWFRL